jgi:uncharacterized membrane protein YhhN
MHAHKLYTRLDTPGTTPLWKVFWLYGVLVSHVLFGGILLLYGQLGTTPLALLLLGFVVYTAWVLNAVWRNAGNVRVPIYGEIARFLTVAWSINAVLVSIFLLLGHLRTGGSVLPF